MSEDDLFNLRLSLIADPVDRRILEHLSGGSQHPEDLARKMGFSRSALEQRVARLVEAGFVQKLAERDSPRVVLVITPEAMLVLDWLRQLRIGGSPAGPRPEPPPSTTTATPEETAKSEPLKPRGLVERVSLPLVLFLLFETVAIVNSYYNYLLGAWNWVVIGWVLYTALGIVAAKLVGWLSRLARKRVKA